MGNCIGEISCTQSLHKVVQYVEDNKIYSNIWDPSCWSVFGRAVRANNDTEGWHHHLNILCENIGHNNINLYELIEVLHREAGLVCNQCQLVGEEKLNIYGFFQSNINIYNK